MISVASTTQGNKKDENAKINTNSLSQMKGRNNKSPAVAELFFDQLFIIYDDNPIRNNFF